MVQKVNSYTLCLEKTSHQWLDTLYTSTSYTVILSSSVPEKVSNQKILYILSQQMLADVKCIVQKNLYFSKSSLVHNTVQLLQYKILTSILLCDKLNWLPNVWSHTAVSVLLPVKKTQEIKQQLAEAWQSNA